MHKLLTVLIAFRFHMMYPIFQLYADERNIILNNAFNGMYEKHIKTLNPMLKSRYQELYVNYSLWL